MERKCNSFLKIVFAIFIYLFVFNLAFSSIQLTIFFFERGGGSLPLYLSYYGFFLLNGLFLFFQWIVLCCCHLSWVFFKKSEISKKSLFYSLMFFYLFFMLFLFKPREIYLNYRYLSCLAMFFLPIIAFLFGLLFNEKTK